LGDYQTVKQCGRLAVYCLLIASNLRIYRAFDIFIFLTHCKL